MKKYSNDSLINSIVISKLKAGWKIRKGKKHNILIAPNSRRLAIPSTRVILMRIKTLDLN